MPLDIEKGAFPKFIAVATFPSLPFCKKINKKSVAVILELVKTAFPELIYVPFTATKKSLLSASYLKLIISLTEGVPCPLEI